MNCPKCKSKLIVSGQAYLETIEEHVMCIEPSLKDQYICSNKNCVCNEHEISWNSDGGTYGRVWKVFSNEENEAPLGSLERQLNVEIYKKGLKKKTYLPAWLLLWFLKPVIVHDYKADKNGNVLSKSYHLEIWKSETPWKPFKKNSEYCIGAMWWISTWIFLWERFKRGHVDKSYNRDFPYRSFEYVIGKLYGVTFQEF